jgi:hypothetical protein
MLALKEFPRLIVALAERRGRRDGFAAITASSSGSGICRRCATSAARRRKRRIENLMELCLPPGEYEHANPMPSLGGFVDRLSLLSEADEARAPTRPASG